MAERERSPWTEADKLAAVDNVLIYLEVPVKSDDPSDNPRRTRETIKKEVEDYIAGSYIYS
jgi:hypothetical protein